ncbi:MAG: phosphatase PAP2 family protein [Egibacteraceae bacterium]
MSDVAQRSWVDVAALGASLLSGSWYALRRPLLQRADVRAGDALRLAGSPVLDRAVVATTDLGSVYAVAGIAATLLASRQPGAAADVAGTGLAAWFLAQGGKTRVRRERPYEAHGVRRLIHPPTGSSYPSGHAAVAAATMTVLADRVRPSRKMAFKLLGGYVAASRVYVGVHYPSDVLGGAGLGIVLGALARGPVNGAVSQRFSG